VRLATALRTNMNGGYRRVGGGGAGGGTLGEPLLGEERLSAAEAAALDRAERRGVQGVALVLALSCAADAGLLGASAAPFGGAEGVSFTRNVGDVGYFVAVRSALVVSAAAWCAVGRGGLWTTWGLYWAVYCTVVFGVGKLIAFDYTSAHLEALPHALLFSWLAVGVAQLKLIERLDYWLTERTRWADREAEGAPDAEGGGAAARVKLAQAEDDEAKARKRQSMFWRKSFWQVLKPYFWPRGAMNKLRCLLTWAFLALSKATNLMSPIYMGYVVQALTDDAKTGHLDMASVTRNVLVYSLLSLASKVLKELQNVVYLAVKQTAYVEIASQTFTHLHSLSLEWHLKKKMGNVLRSMDRGLDAANQIVTYLFLYLVPTVIECMVVFIIFYQHFNVPAISATAFMAFVAYAVITVQITLWRKRFREETNKHDNDYHDKATDSLINYETVKYFTNEQYEIDEYTTSIHKYQKYSVNTAFSLSLLNSTQALVIQACTGVSLVLAAREVHLGHLSVGQFVAIGAYIANLFAPLSFLGSIYNAVVQSIVDMQNLSDVLQEQPDLVDAPGAKALIPAPSGAEGPTVEFRSVVFHYPTLPPDTGIKGISFRIAPGTTTAIVGTTGAGKSTLGRLLFRFYDPAAGKILISDQDIKLVTQKSLRQAIGVVAQDQLLFNNTIRHNVCYGRRDATQEEIDAACESAQILDFIRSLPEGFETQVGERGLRLSGGEKQRVCIARCLLKNPPIVRQRASEERAEERQGQGSERESGEGWRG
jgi:ABC-type transport system involved in Fe-S cluster assembly fused permease/ATPase subunit